MELFTRHADRSAAMTRENDYLYHVLISETRVDISVTLTMTRSD